VSFRNGAPPKVVVYQLIVAVLLLARLGSQTEEHPRKDRGWWQDGGASQPEAGAQPSNPETPRSVKDPDRLAFRERPGCP
jgi:hypothetical protein